MTQDAGKVVAEVCSCPPEGYNEGGIIWLKPLPPDGTQLVLASDYEAMKAERDRLRYALEIVAGLRQPADNLMSNADIASAALAAKETPK